ncbi:MAG: helicase HerA-like domain-containing protein [Prevotella sp.]|nr:helicase HerA-like domain-containing protein [Prevotella sp.]
MGIPLGLLNRHALVAGATGTGKTRTLQPGESETLSLTITQRDLACFDEAQNAWVLDAGDYTLEIGANARDARLKAHIQVSAPLVVERVNGVLR